MNNMMPATLSYQQAIMPVDPGAIAAAESVKARIQSAYVMAMQRPRSEEQARARILESCKRPEFAARAEYSKPVGNSRVKGPSIRFAELAIRSWGNINVETQVVYEDQQVRRVKVTILDLETNATFGKEIQIRKTVERKDGRGREIVGERANTNGEKVFIVLATDDELHNKEAAQISKVIRNEGLRLIPQDIVDEAMNIARKTLADRDAKDPQAAKKAVMDAFTALGIKPKELEKYLGHSLDTVSPSELDDLRGVYTAINGGEASWADYVQPKDEPEDINAKLGKSTATNRPSKDEMQSRRENTRAELEDMGVLDQVTAEMGRKGQGPWTAWDSGKCKKAIDMGKAMLEAQQQPPAPEVLATVECPALEMAARPRTDCDICTSRDGCPSLQG